MQKHKGISPFSSFVIGVYNFLSSLYDKSYSQSRKFVSNKKVKIISNTTGFIFENLISLSPPISSANPQLLSPFCNRVSRQYFRLLINSWSTIQSGSLIKLGNFTYGRTIWNKQIMKIWILLLRSKKNFETGPFKANDLYKYFFALYLYWKYVFHKWCKIWFLLKTTTFIQYSFKY